VSPFQSAARKWAAFEAVRLRNPRALCLEVGISPADLGREADDWAGTADDWIESFGSSRCAEACKAAGLDWEVGQPRFAAACQRALSAELRKSAQFRRK